MSQGFNWNDVAYEMAPISQYTDLYSNQPRIYMFEGATIIDLILLLGTTILTMFWLIVLIKSESSVTKSMMTVTVSQIFVNLSVRLIKTAILLLVQYPQFSWLFVASSVETSFHYTLYLQFTSSVLLYVFLREKDLKSSWTLFYYIPSIAVSLFVSVLNVNFNQLLFSFPFYIYVIFYVAMSVSNVVILIGILVSCTKYTREKLAIRCRLFIFVIVSSPPVLFNTVITIMDLLFMVVGISQQFPIPYIVMTTYRYNCFEATPVFILIAFGALMPDLKEWSISKTTTTAEATIIVTEPTSSSSSNRPIPIVSQSSIPESSIPIPNRIDPEHQEFVAAPVPTYGNLNYGMGALVVHIQPVNNS
ncbi:Serpentine receptor class gamma [Caenorhabditis elegans]|uniref:Serpentine receptor class gamma n=1 Tax=Caenorhabditis elegans TaxID=6239 RepID=Q7YWX4_CAEEL|nr:Serpentine receptor class gamma [Caenorhabditis elegans]CAE17882.2 Serpentine receptor class gamma [Caenorhabditis elegans]|eukprot:NP_001023269.2 Uncharacterized protein CELE_K04D7.6 [Caenorhabditis elegans]